MMGGAIWPLLTAAAPASPARMVFSINELGRSHPPPATQRYPNAPITTTAGTTNAGSKANFRSQTASADAPATSARLSYRAETAKPARSARAASWRPVGRTSAAIRTLACQAKTEAIRIWRTCSMPIRAVAGSGVSSTIAIVALAATNRLSSARRNLRCQNTTAARPARTFSRSGAQLSAVRERKGMPPATAARMSVDSGDEDAAAG